MRFLKYSILCFAFCFFQAAYAQNLLEDFRKDLPDIELLPVEDFEAQTKLTEKTPLNDNALKYAIRLPQAWFESEQSGSSGFSLSSQVFAQLASYYGPNILDKRPSIKIRASNIEFQTTAEQWFLDYALERGYTIQAMEPMGDHRVEAIYIFAERDVTYAVRTIAQINGERIVLFEYFLPADFWAEQKAMQAQVSKSFRLTNSVENFSEPVVDYAFLDIARFSYPENWELRAEELRSIERFQVEILNIERNKGTSLKGGRKNIPVLLGRVDVVAVSYFAMEDLEKEVGDLKAMLTQKGLMIESEIERKKNVKIDEQVEDSAQYIYKLGDSNNDLHDYEYWLTILNTYDYYFFVTLLTPARGTDYETWTRNTKAYETLIQSFNVPEENLIYDE